MMTRSPEALTTGHSEPPSRTMPRPAPQPQRLGVGTARVAVDGMHLSCAGRPFRVRGVTYGSFLPRADGAPFPVWERCRADLRPIADAGLNAIRTYDVPPPELLELAAEAGLRVIVGLQYPAWR